MEIYEQKKDESKEWIILLWITVLYNNERGVASVLGIGDKGQGIRPAYLLPHSFELGARSLELG